MGSILCLVLAPSVDRSSSSAAILKYGHVSATGLTYAVLLRWRKLLAGISCFASSFDSFLQPYHNTSTLRSCLQSKGSFCKTELFMTRFYPWFQLHWPEFIQTSFGHLQSKCRSSLRKIFTGKNSGCTEEVDVGGHRTWKAPVFWGMIHVSLNLNLKIWPQSYEHMGKSLPLTPGAACYFEHFELQKVVMEIILLSGTPISPVLSWLCHKLWSS